MESEVQELKKEIEVLNEKVEILERKERKRKTLFYVKILVKMALISFMLYSVYQGYQYIVKELPGVINKKIEEIRVSTLQPYS